MSLNQANIKENPTAAIRSFSSGAAVSITFSINNCVIQGKKKVLGLGELGLVGAPTCIGEM